MNDNFFMIINVYLDYEDILGLIGIDVVNEISYFIGENSLVFISE